MNIKYRAEIDGLRALAVIAVIFYHAKLTIRGVEIFNGGFI
jgi:peptidoglycan/LPS O-acetylase OafA/YrhL